MSKTFEKLLQEAVNVERQLRAYDDPLYRKMTAKTFVAAACKQAGSTEAQVKALNGKVGMEVAGVLLRMRRAVAEPTTNAPYRHLSHMIAGNEDATVALARAGSTTLELFALAALLEAEENPGVFGACDDPKGWGEAAKELTTKRNELVKLLENSWDKTDVVFLPVEERYRREGFIKAAYAITGGQVLVGPDSGLNLVRWCLNNPRAKAA